jgi:ubiquinone/menaquinone biosynthesis C-methylase UbiE
MDLDRIKDQGRSGWSKGEYSGLSQMLRPAAERLADACAVSAGQEVLDVAAGDGNFAVVCATEGASVVASDFAPGMVEQGRARTAAEGFEIEWVEADAEALPFEDGRFECVGSVFGAMIAPRPRVAAEEMFRVTRPGNTVGMTAWMPKGPTYDMFRLTREFAPPAPDDMPRIEQWSDEATVHERFEGLANSIEIEPATLPWTADSPEDFVMSMERHAPMQVAAKERMPADEYARMREALVAMAREWAGGDGSFSVDAHYVVIVARRRG